MCAYAYVLVLLVCTCVFVQLKVNRDDIDAQQVPNYLGTTAQVLKLVQHNENDAWLAFSLMHKMQVHLQTAQTLCAYIDGVLPVCLCMCFHKCFKYKCSNVRMYISVCTYLCITRAHVCCFLCTPVDSTV